MGPRGMEPILLEGGAMGVDEGQRNEDSVERYK
jgi:hypothetical protein